MYLSNECSFAHNVCSAGLSPIVIAMNSAAPAHWQSAGTVKTSPRLLAACLLASVAVHATLLLALPGWRRTTPLEVPAVLDVVLVPADNPQPVVQPPSPPERPPAARHTPSVRATQTAPVAPVRAETAVTKTSAEPALPAIAETARVPAAASPAAPAAPRSESVTAPPVFNAAYLRNPPPRYPRAARRSSEEGTVLLRVLVTIDGTAARVELDRSSGSASLDSAALEAVRNWRFVPARRGAENVEDWVRVPVVFRLES
jgi:protein TonB